MRLVGHVFPEKNMLNGSGRRPFPSQVRGHCLCNCRQQRKLDRHIGLRPTDPQYSALPVHILQSNSKDFGCAETIRRQQQHDRIITFARRFRSRDRSAGSSARRSTAKQRGGRSSIRYRGAITPLARSAGNLPVMLQKSEKRSERTAGIRNGSFRKTGGKLPHKRIHICQARPSQWLRFHAAVARGSHARSRHRAPASFPRPHCGLADNGNTPSVTVTSDGGCLSRHGGNGVPSAANAQAHA